MSASLLNVLKKVPAPLFGTAATALQFTATKATKIPKAAPWLLPAGAGALWFVWPAVDDEWKASMFGGSSSEEAAPAPAKVELSAEAQEKVEKAYIVESVELSDEEKAAVKAMGKGDYSALEKEWDTFQIKAENPEEDDDDDDDDDDEDEEEEEEEEDDE